MKSVILTLSLLSLVACSAPNTPHSGSEPSEVTTSERPAPVTLEDRFAILALDCVHREYPNKISHVLQSAADAQTPSALTPAFYGCFDWHSSVHGHWLLSRLLNTNPDGVFAYEIRTKLAQSFTEEKLAGELAYYTAKGRGSFERPYGIAWYLQLVAELDESADPEMLAWRETLRPLEEAIVAKTRAWLPNLSYPVRLGTHNQTAFAFGLMLDYARRVDDQAFETDLVNKALSFHRTDLSCPLEYEPSGEDFLSPCLMEADLMRRVLAPQDFAVWLAGFLPQIPLDGGADWLEPGIVLDASDGKLVHLDGVNLSRAWALEGIASALPDDDLRVAALMASSQRHREVGIAAVSDEHYSGSHWLASFATYLTTKRGLPSQEPQP
jgi:hypothetical protein